MSSDNATNADEGHDDWEHVFELLAMSDKSLQEMIEHHTEALAVVTALWEGRCKSRAKHKRFMTLWESLEHYDSGGNGPTPGTKARLVWEYLQTRDVAEPAQIADAIGLAKRNVQSVLSSRRELFQHTEDGWQLVVKAEDTMTMSTETITPACNPRETSGARPKCIAEPETGSDEDLRTLIYEYLSRMGAKKPAVIAAELAIHKTQLEHLLDHERFQRTPDGYAIS